ncbi:hypothetical protein BH09BAC1_BH09BAC1_01830 [soil metagenome]
MIKLCVTVMLALCFKALSAQTQPNNRQELPTFYYQIFLEEPIDTVNQIYYQQDSMAVKYQLAPDKKAIYLLDYDGERTIRIEYVKAGTPANMTKPHCHVHALEHL